MKGTVKAIIVGAIICGVGLCLILLALGLNDWNLEFNMDWETKVYESETTVTDIDLDFAAGQLIVEPYDGDVVKVEYPESSRYTITCELVGTKLSISTAKLKWYNSFMWFNKIPSTKVYIPRSQVLNFDIEVSAGQVTLNDGSYGNIDIELNAGAISFKDVHCLECNVEVNAGTLNVDKLSCDKFSSDVSAGNLTAKELTCDLITIEMSAGNTTITVVGDKSEYEINASVSAGNCNVRNQKGTDPNKKINVDVSAGNATVNFKTAK